MNSQIKYSVVITAAGKSERMGFPKPFLIFEKEKNITFLEQIVNQYEKINSEKIAIVLNQSNFEYYKSKNFNFLDKHEVIINKNLEHERFYSIQLGLSEIEPDNFVFLQPADNPFLKTKLLHTLLTYAKKNTYTVPTYNKKGGHPIIISPQIWQEILTKYEKNSNLKEVLSNYQRKNLVYSSASIHLNINDIDEYKKIITLNKTT